MCNCGITAESQWKETLTSRCNWNNNIENVEGLINKQWTKQQLSLPKSIGVGKVPFPLLINLVKLLTCATRRYNDIVVADSSNEDLRHLCEGAARRTLVAVTRSAREKDENRDSKPDGRNPIPPPKPDVILDVD